MPGTTKRARVEEDAAAAQVVLTGQALLDIDETVPGGSVTGARTTDAALARDRLSTTVAEAGR